MVLRWEGGAPPDAQEWVDALSKALGQESAFYWVRFYRQAGGWRFDLERRCEPGPDGSSSYRRPDESVVVRAFRSLVESGKRLDPSWNPAASPSAVVVRMPQPAGQPADAAPRRNQQRSAPENPPAVNGTKAKPGSVAPADSSPRVPPLTAIEPSATHRFPDRRSPGLVLAAASAFLLAAFGWWLFRDSLPWPPGSTPAPSPAPAPIEAVPGGPQEPQPTTPSSPDGARSSAGRRPVDPGGVGDTPRDSRQSPAQPSGPGRDESRPTPAPARRPAAPPPPPRHGDLADVNDPGVTPPVVVSQSCPPYPPLALERGLSGTVRLTALVDETGAVAGVSSVRASPRGVGFEGAATGCVLSRVYRPATKQDVPVRVRLPIRIEFKPPAS